MKLLKMISVFQTLPQVVDNVPEIKKQITGIRGNKRNELYYHYRDFDASRFFYCDDGNVYFLYVDPVDKLKRLRRVAFNYDHPSGNFCPVSISYVKNEIYLLDETRIPNRPDNRKYAVRLGLILTNDF